MASEKQDFLAKPVEFDGVTKTVTEWCAHHKLKPETVYGRWQRGTPRTQWFESIESAAKRRMPNGLAMGKMRQCKSCLAVKSASCFRRGRAVCTACNNTKDMTEKNLDFIAKKYI